MRCEASRVIQGQDGSMWAARCGITSLPGCGSMLPVCVVSLASHTFTDAYGRSAKFLITAFGCLVETDDVA